MNSKILVTGGAGFLGSHFVRRALNHGVREVTNVDCLTYAGDPRRLADVEDSRAYQFVKLDVADETRVKQLIADERPDAIVHYAAESHVTRSESDPDRFYRTNVDGTRNLFEAAVASGVRRVVHVSTDEVYGSILTGSFKESDKAEGAGQAASPYSQSKALADDLARSYSDRLEVVVVRPTNAFGPWQYPEKVLPRWITRGLRDRPLLVWGDGLYIRQWLYCEDFASAVDLVLEQGEPGEVYNVGPTHEPEITNLDLAQWLVRYLGSSSSQVQMTGYDRPDHDRRYAVDSSKIRGLGWAPGDVWTQLRETVDWYRESYGWWEPLVGEAESIYTDTDTDTDTKPVSGKAQV
ncbi:MAG: NAD-dependent epimerase/dehydratase family protein [Actinomycetota bacterium]